MRLSRVRNSTEWPASTALTPSAIARWVLPTPGGPSRTTFSARSTKLRPASSRTCRRSIDGERVRPERGVVIGDRDPALGGRLEEMLRDALLAVVDRDGAIQRDPHADRTAGQRGGHAVAIAADLDVGVPADLARLPVRRVVALGRQGLQRWGLPGEALGDDLVHGAVHARVGFLPEPPLGELVEVGPALEGAIADEEVVLDVPDVALVLALGLRAGRATGPGTEAVVAGQIDEARVELDVAATRVRDDGGLLIVDQDLGGAAAEPLEGPH